MLDLTRGRLGGGLALERTDVRDLDACLRHVVDEIASRHPGREIRFQVTGQGVITCDRRRIEQVVSNLVANAIQHGDAHAAVDVELQYEPDALTIAVANLGTPISEDIRPRLFQPFARAASGEPRNGLGLGLFIVSEIARAHGGTVSVTSCEPDGTRFMVRLPRVTRST